MLRVVAAVSLFLLASQVGHSQDLVRQALDDPYFQWRSVENAEARVYYKESSFAERHRHTLLRSVTTAIEEDLEFLGESAYEDVLNVFFVDTREEMERIVGRPVSGYANWGASGIFLVFAPGWRSFETHEFAHIITMGVWGAPHASSTWMIEGLCIASDGWCREFSVDEIAYHLLTSGQLPPLEELPAKLAELGEIRGGFYAASVIGFIRHQFGADAVRKLWTNGSVNLPATLGLSFDKIEPMWKEYLERQVGDGVQVDMGQIDESGCG
jgi:hypothetical protein